MNTEHLAIGYRALEPAKTENFNLDTWQNAFPERPLASAVKELHNYGMTACAGGLLALSPEFQALGGSISSVGSPIFEGGTHQQALYAFYETKANSLRESAIDLIHNTVSHRESDDFYDVEFISDVTPKQVQEKFAILYFILKWLEKNNESIKNRA
ncbi:MAG: hypothetical protein COB69_00345 [Phycisphaera sp.]|nr:MAG: hypothetical protein COB69_00345 [Phycisphaera sp.]